MKIIDRFVIRDKTTEKMVRDMDVLLTKQANSNALNKEDYVEVHALILELIIKLFKQLENNVTTPRTLLDYTGKEVQDACLRVGPCKVFDNDADYVVAVMQELTK